MKTQDGKIYIFSGKSRCGKSTKAAMLLQELNPVTVFAWDPEAQWCEIAGFKKVTSLNKLMQDVIAGKPGRYAFVSNGDLKADFEKLCAVAFHWGTFRGGGVFIAEELADVTTSAKAGPQWGKLIRRVLKRGMSVIAISQRWQEADKTAIGNYSEAFIFKSSEGDEEYLAKKFGLPLQEVSGLEQFYFIHKKDFGGYSHGALPWAKKPQKPQSKSKSM